MSAGFAKCPPSEMPRWQLGGGVGDVGRLWRSWAGISLSWEPQVWMHLIHTGPSSLSTSIREGLPSVQLDERCRDSLVSLTSAKGIRGADKRRDSITSPARTTATDGCSHTAGSWRPRACSASSSCQVRDGLKERNRQDRDTHHGSLWLIPLSA